MELSREKLSYLQITNADYIDELYARYRENPDSVDPSWRYFFDGLDLGSEMPSPEAIQNGHATPGAAVTASAAAGVDLLAEARVAELIQAYRSYGHLLANVNPLAPPPATHPLLDLSRFGLAQADLPKAFQAGKLIGIGPAKLGDILARLRESYCGSVGIEYAQVSNAEEREWLRSRLENGSLRAQPEVETRKFILQRLTDAEAFEKFLHTRYVAQKRFSGEGGDAIVPGLDCVIETASDLGANDFVLGMAHRGRLNVLVNTFKKKPEMIFTEFEGQYKPDLSLGEGDVKYHMGHSHDAKTRGGKSVHLSMAFNPSHLEFVNPVVEGMARARQTLAGDRDRTSVVPILIHGDAAFAGQGVCYETIQMGQLQGYATGGTLHVVINNQVGFTTSPKDSRSTTYSTDLAKAFDGVILHVHGDDAEAVWNVMRLSTEYRQKFRKDIFVDLVCYRKHGHNEGDEPTFTQPLLYKAIKTHPTPREVYAEKLASQGILTSDQSRTLLDEAMNRLTEAQARTKAENPTPLVSSLEGRWKKLRRPAAEDLFKPVATAVPEKKLKELAAKLNHVPQGFNLHPKLGRFFEGRLKAIDEGKGIDWGNGEALAFASLLDEGTSVRITGQDAERGTFTHRHSVLNDYETGASFSPFNKIRDGQAAYHVHNSHLSEVAVMGYEYGYSLSDPDSLVIWEAQFGDFANGAQVIIDQFLAAGESKWQRMSGLVLLLPHGYEGQGPEHSSARLERFLQLCGRNNLFVCDFTTPAQLFHALRRHMKRDFRKPMVVMSPKSLLRHPQAISALEDFTKGSFQEVLDDLEASAAPKSVSKVLLCTGKVYYDLLAEKTAKKRSDVAIIRVEQLYPWPAAKLAQVLGQYTNAKSFVWVQEEPRNMGAWMHVYGYASGGLSTGDVKSTLGKPLQYVGRDVCASPAVGSSKVHEKEQKALVERAFAE